MTLSVDQILNAIMYEKCMPPLKKLGSGTHWPLHAYTYLYFGPLVHFLLHVTLGHVHYLGS